MPNPWDIPPFPQVGDADKEITYAAIGNALTSWEKFEIQFAIIFAAIVGGGPRTSSATRAYGSVIAFRGRASMVKAAMEVHLSMYDDAYSKQRDELDKAFSSLWKDADNFSARRNEIAHGVVEYYVPPYSPPDPKATGTYILYPTWYATNKREFVGVKSNVEWTRPKYAYSSVEIRAFSEHFLTLVPRAALIAAQVMKDKSPMLAVQLKSSP